MTVVEVIAGVSCNVETGVTTCVAIALSKHPKVAIAAKIVRIILRGMYPLFARNLF